MIECLDRCNSEQDDKMDLETEITINLVVLPPCPTVDPSESVAFLSDVTQTIIKWACRKRDSFLVKQEELKAVLDKTPQFCGTTHCEAILMCFNEKSHDLKASRAIGINKKCCYICDWLADRYNEGKPEDEKFILPGSHGIITPWVPPHEGMDSTMMRTLAIHLLRVLLRTETRGFPFNSPVEPLFELYWEDIYPDYRYEFELSLGI
ncbi:hypothetical protein BDP27DRAFT_835046 [Rhodocollybia butyracea]|uniref:Uncharacterized protein n=1 Tax=Rhodocollybia butyracea TaxID=206335 RepID=A0A9P5PS92_9AGAR|nr:hypothetical protein BDP27DRAFT_835046 [Rhodocollybia butyracea]